MGDDAKRDSRDRILERRAAFVAAALASVAAGCVNPRPCLSMAQDIGPDDAGAKPASSATTTAGPVKPEEDAGPPEPPPVPCLSPMLPPDAGAAPCLKMPEGSP